MKKNKTKNTDKIPRSDLGVFFKKESVLLRSSGVFILFKVFLKKLGILFFN
jgi:hypothetical protein